MQLTIHESAAFSQPRFELASSSSDTTLTRTFSVELRSPIALPVVALLRPLLRVVLRRHHAALQARLARGE